MAGNHSITVSKNGTNTTAGLQSILNIEIQLCIWYLYCSIAALPVEKQTNGCHRKETNNMKLMPKDMKKLLKAALGEIECDFVLTNGKVVNVFTGEILDAAVYVYDGFIAHVEYNEPDSPLMYTCQK